MNHEDSNRDSIDSYKCSDCDAVFSRKVKFEKHCREVHTNDVEEIYETEKTPPSSPRKRKRLKQKQKPSPKLQSKNCEDEEKIPYEIPSEKIHPAILNRKEKFNCEFCEKQFVTESDLRLHCMQHHEKPFLCKQCLQRFSWRDQMAAHTCTPLNNKANSEILPGACQSQSIDFYAPFGNTSVLCGLCQRKFAQKGHLISHYRRTHKRELITLNI